jgi:dihydrodipicolinate synthase/N-acetylneuraminate lyase
LNIIEAKAAMPIPNSDPILTIPMVTPFDGEDRVDYDAISFNVERWRSTPLNGFIIGTASGEETLLGEEEKIQIASTVATTLDGDGFVVGGIDCPSVTETLRRAEAFAQAGAEMVRLRLPRHPERVIPYFEQVLPHCPVPALLMHQCNPERFGLAGEPAAAPETIGQVSRMDGVFGYVTDHDIRFETRVRRFVPPERKFWICNGSLALTGTFIGCNGITTAFSNVWPEALHHILSLGMAGRYDEAWELQHKVQSVDAVMLPYQSAGIKAAMNLLGFRGTQPRRPSPPMPAEAIGHLQTVMQEVGLLAK